MPCLHANRFKQAGSPNQPEFLVEDYAVATKDDRLTDSVIHSRRDEDERPDCQFYKHF